MLLKTLYDASYSVVQGVGARRVGDVRRVGRCRGPTRRKIPISTVVQWSAQQGQRQTTWCPQDSPYLTSSHGTSRPHPAPPPATREHLHILNLRA